jgi:hypothetical protein
LLTNNEEAVKKVNEVLGEIIKARKYEGKLTVQSPSGSIIKDAWKLINDYFHKNRIQFLGW